MSSYGLLGGGELSMAEFLAHRPPHVEALALLVEDGPLRGHLTERGIETWSAAGYSGPPTPRRLVRFTRSMMSLISRRRPDVVWATGLKAATLAVPACRLLGVPLVWHKVDFSLDATLTRPLAVAVHGVVSVSEAVAAPLGRLRRRRLLAVVGPPVRLPDDLRIEPNTRTPTIGTLATLTPIKGQGYMIEAGALLREEFPDLQVVLAGATSAEHPRYVEQLWQRAEQLGIADRVQFAGFFDDVTEILMRLTVFVNATHEVEDGYGREGLSGAMLEASWAGLPVVASRAGGTPEGVLDGVTGTLVEPQDAGALARAIAPYLRDPRLAREAGAAGQRFTREHFAPAPAATRLFDALQRCADLHRGSTRQ